MGPLKMSQGGVVRAAREMIAGMQPRLRPEVYVFATCAGGEHPPALLNAAIGLFREDEGLSLILPVDTARADGFGNEMQMRCITLSVHSALDGVGLTAAVADALAAQSIACNMVAAYHHDHVFVPAAQAEEALRVLLALQERTAAQVEDTS